MNPGMKLGLCALGVVALFASSSARAQDVADASDAAGQSTADAGDAGSAACRPEDERGPCTELEVGEACVLSTGQSGACYRTSCLTTSSGDPVLMCQPGLESSDGCCSGSGSPAMPAIGTVGFAIWHRRRRRTLRA